MRHSKADRAAKRPACRAYNTCLQQQSGCDAHYACNLYDGPDKAVSSDMHKSVMDRLGGFRQGV